MGGSSRPSLLSRQDYHTGRRAYADGMAEAERPGDAFAKNPAESFLPPLQAAAAKISLILQAQQ